MKAWITKYKRWLWWGAGMLALCAGVLLGLPAMMEPVPQEGVSLPGANDHPGSNRCF